MSTPTSFKDLLQFKILPIVHKLALSVSAMGIIFRVMHYQGADSLLMLGLSLLAGTYFLMAHTQLSIPKDVEPSLYTTILFKVMYIGSSVCIIGTLFYLLRLEGASNMLLIGCASTGVAVLASAFLSVQKNDNWIVLKDVILRATAIVAIAAYVLTKLSGF